MEQVNNPHDAFFKAAFSDKRVVRAFLKEILSSQILNSVDLDSLQLIQGSFVDTNLNAIYTDLLFKCKSRNLGQERYISILLEHKSFFEPYLPFQLLKYITSSYDQQISNKESPIPVIPIVISHSKRAYDKKSPMDFFGNYSADIQKFVPNFDYVLVDILKMEPVILEKLENAFLIATMMAFKNSNDPDRLVEQLGTISRFLVKSHSRNLIRSFFVYFSQLVDLNDEKIINLYKALPEPVKSEAMNTHDILVEKGRIEGRVEGRVEGIDLAIKIKKLYDKDKSPQVISRQLNIAVQKVKEIIKELH